MTTTSEYLSVSQNLSRYQAMTAAEPAVKTATDYYTSNIGGVNSIADLVGNYRLLSYALDAYGLGAYVNDTALVTKVLQGGVTNSKSLANTLGNPQWQAFAKAFDFVDQGAPSISSESAVAATTGDYVENQLENDEGQQDPGVQLALYFQRVAPTVTNAYEILGDPNLLKVVQTIFGLPPETGSTNIDQEASVISKLVPLSSLQDPKTLQTLVTRFTAMYDLDYGPASNSPNGLTVSSDGSSSGPSAASTILSGVISSTGSSLASLNASSSGLFSDQLLDSLQGLTLGGV